MNIIIIHAIPLTLLGEIDYDNKSALTSFSDTEELLREVELKEGNMEFRMEQFVGLGTTMAGVILVFLLGFVVFFLSRRGLKTLLHLEYISDPVYVVTMNIIRWLLIIAVVIISLQSMGVKVGNIMAGMLTVAGMIAIGFIAVWSVMSNILHHLDFIAYFKDIEGHQKPGAENIAHNAPDCYESYGDLAGNCEHTCHDIANTHPSLI
ncbi:MAG: hypothetical protein KJ985_11070 [Proteobacteria bacterium]|nr:hypothetical protein [Pseudomonadota bacterium]